MDAPKQENENIYISRIDFQESIRHELLYYYYYLCVYILLLLLLQVTNKY